MRPIRKGASSVVGDFNKYEDAKNDLVGRLGLYCSYCERRIATELAVEHIEPKKGCFGKPLLAKRWSNFLLACKNCNSCKGSDQVNFKRLLLPDRDNTFQAYTYELDGTVSLSSMISLRQKVMARNTLRLVGLDKPVQVFKDSNDELIYLDRAGQRMEAFGVAQVAFGLLQAEPHSDSTKKAIVLMAKSEGFFSIWMQVFDAYPDMKLQLIRAFKGTEESGCFDMATGDPIIPAPNLDGLSNGGKV